MPADARHAAHALVRLRHLHIVCDLRAGDLRHAELHTHIEQHPAQLAKVGGFDPRAHRAKPVDPAEREWQKAERAAREAAELAELTEKQQAASALAESIWTAAEPAPADHPYLVRKRIPVDALRVYRGGLCIGTAACDGALVIPARDAEGKLWTLEFVLTDGQKRYLPNGRKAGCFSLIGGLLSSVPSTLLIGEGYATCATLAAATGYPAAVAFDAGNLHAVATALRGQYPDARIVVCADDDHTTKGNPGVTKARAAAEAVAGIVAVPDFGSNRPANGTDFNDLAAHLGPDAVAAAVRAALAPAGSADVGKGKAAPAAAKPAKRPKTARAQDGKSRFVVDDKGVWFHGFNNQGDPLPPHWVSTRIDVIAETRNEMNSEWGYLLEFTDRDGILKRWAVPAGLFAGDGTEVKQRVDGYLAALERLPHIARVLAVVVLRALAPFVPEGEALLAKLGLECHPHLTPRVAVVGRNIAERDSRPLEFGHGCITHRFPLDARRQAPD